MTVHDLFRDRMTEPNPVLDPLLEPQKLDSRNLVHLRLHVSVGRVGARNGTLWYQRYLERRPEGEQLWSPRGGWARNCLAGTAIRTLRSVRRNPKDSRLVELRSREDVARQGFNRDSG